MNSENTARERKETITHNYWHSFRGAALTSDIFHTTICRMDSSPSFQPPHPIFEKSSTETTTVCRLHLGFYQQPFPPAQLPRLGVSGQEQQQHNRILCSGPCALKESPPWWKKKKPSCRDRMAKWAVPAPWQSLPFLVSFCWSKNDFTWNITTRVRWEESAILLGPKWKLWCESHNPLHPHYLFQLE